jgi:hypothetical protein
MLRLLSVSRRHATVDGTAREHSKPKRESGRGAKRAHATDRGTDVEIRQVVRVPRDRTFDLTIGERLPLVCWGVMPSGMLRHPGLTRG